MIVQTLTPPLDNPTPPVPKQPPLPASQVLPPHPQLPEYKWCTIATQGPCVASARLGNIKLLNWEVGWVG